ncbi:hypothetical protein, conserved [Leishmania tarentolae]|uniref:Uncharacterized protein n=1 Tax=Leishmania tarentolae TaxID=5689 RepID=A0A640KEM8_LEITA|nr:hypothetical protein, conserved [Leishmania tarentolae]
MRRRLHWPTETSRDKALCSSSSMSSGRDAQSPLTTSTLLATCEDFVTEAPFSSSIEAIRARLHEVVRDIDHVMGTAQQPPSPTSRSAAAGVDISSPPADPLGANDKGDGRRLHGSPTSSAAALALLRARQQSSAPRSAAAGTLSACQPLPRPHSDQTTKDSPTRGPTLATRFTASHPHESASTASATADTGTGLSATYAAALDFWRANGRCPHRPAPMRKEGLTTGPLDDAALTSTSTSTPSAEPVEGSHNPQAAASITFASPQPYSKRQGTAENANAAVMSHTDTDILADTVVRPAVLSNTLPTAAAKAAVQTDYEATTATLSRPLRAAVPASLAATMPPKARSRPLTPDGSRTCHTQPPQVLADVSYFSTTAAAPLPSPSSVTTLSARLAALRATDTTQRNRMLEEQKPQQGWLHEDKRQAFSRTSALMTHDTSLFADYGRSAHGGKEGDCSKCFCRKTTTCAHHQRNQAEPQQLPQSSAAASTSTSDTTCDHNWLVCSPPSKLVTPSTAKTRQAHRASRQDETSFIVSLAQQIQAVREEAWRDAQDNVKLEPPGRPPPLLPVDTSGLARHTPPSRVPEHHRGGRGEKPLFTLETSAETRSGAAINTAASRALTSLTAPLGTLQAGLSPSVIAVTALSAGVAENESLPMQEELAMRERLAARRQQQNEGALVMHKGPVDHQRQQYERLSDTRDRDVAEHLRNELIRQAAVQVSAQARVAQVRAALPDQPEAVTSDELFAIRLHAQQLERLREQTQWVTGRAPVFHAGEASLSAVDVAPTKDYSFSLVPAAGAGESCSTAAPQQKHLRDGASATGQQARTTTSKEKHSHCPSEKVVPTTVSTRTKHGDVTSGPGVAVGDVRRSAGVPFVPAQITASAEWEATPGQTVTAHQACPSSSSHDLMQRHVTEPHPHRFAIPAHGNGRVSGEATHATERFAGGSIDEDVSTSTQLAPPFSDIQVKADSRAKTLSSSPVRVQKSVSPPSASHTHDVGTGRPACATPPQSSTSRLSRAASSPVQLQNALTVSAADDAERDLITSSPLGRCSSRSGTATGSIAADRLASIQSIQLHVSARRGTAWQEDSTASDISSSSSSLLPASVSPFRASGRASRAGDSVRPHASRTCSPLHDLRVESSRSASRHRCPTPAVDDAGCNNAAREGSSARCSPRATSSPASRRKPREALQAHRRAVQDEAGKRAALRAQARLSERGIVVDVQLTSRRVPSLVKLSKDRKELLFYLHRIEHVPLQALLTSPQSSVPAFSAEHGGRSLSPATSASRVPGARSTADAMSRVPKLSSSSSPAAARPPRFYPPWIPGAATPVTSSMQPHTDPVNMTPAGMLVNWRPALGRGSDAVGAPPWGVARSSSSPKGQQLVTSAPPQRGGSVSSPSPLLPLPHTAAPTLLRQDVTPNTATSTRPIRVRELHHFPYSYARLYAPFGVIGYERDLGLGGPQTWEDVSGVLCGPASFEVLRRYCCPLFAEVQGPLCAPYRLYLIIPHFKRIDVPQDAVLLVLDFQTRVDWVFFLLAMQRVVTARGDCDSGDHIGVSADSSSRSCRAAQSPALSYGRALWMLAVQRLQRARALRGMNPLDLVKIGSARHPEQLESQGTVRKRACDAPSVRPSALEKGSAYPLAGGPGATRRFEARPLTRSGHSHGSECGVRVSSPARISALPRGRNHSPARCRDPGVDFGWEVAAGTERVPRKSPRSCGARFSNPKQCTSPARFQASPPSLAGTAGTEVAAMTSQEVSKPRSELLKRVSRRLGASRFGEDK